MPGAPVVDEMASVLGMVDLDVLLASADDQTRRAVAFVREPILATDDGLDDALGALADHRRSWAPVVSGGRLVGVLSVRDVMAAYRVALGGNVRQVRGLRAGGIIIEAEIAEDSYLAGRLVADVPWPRDAVLVAIERTRWTCRPSGGPSACRRRPHLDLRCAVGGPEVEALVSSASEPVDVEQDTRAVRGAAS